MRRSRCSSLRPSGSLIFARAANGPFCSARRCSRARRSRDRKREEYGVELDEQSDATPAPEELIDRRRARELLDALLAEMPLELRVVFVLCEIEQLTSGEIAEVVGVPSGTVASRLRRARADFAERVSRLEARRKFRREGS